MKKRLNSMIAVILSLLTFFYLLPLQAFAYSGEDDIENVLEAGGEVESVEDLSDETPFGRQLTAEDIAGEEVSLRSEDTKHFRLQDGSYVAVVYDTAVHYLDETGQWSDIDNRLIETQTLELDTQSWRQSQAEVQAETETQDQAEGQAETESQDQPQSGKGRETRDELKNKTEKKRKIDSYSRKRGATDLQIAAQSDWESNSILHTGYENYSIGLTLMNANRTQVKEVKPEKTDDNSFAIAVEPANIKTTIAYENILDGVDLEYVLYGENVKENIVVKEKKESYEFTFELDMKNLVPVKGEDGAVYLIDPESGEAVYMIPAPYMVDANGDYSEAAWYTLPDASGADEKGLSGLAEKLNPDISGKLDPLDKSILKTVDGTGIYTLTITASEEWMNAEGRAFPVVIDPPLILLRNSSNMSMATVKNNGSIVRAGAMYVGWTDVGNVKMRTYLKVNTLPTMPANSTIVNAQIMLAQINNGGGENGYSGIGGMDTLKIEARALTGGTVDTWSWNTSYSGVLTDYKQVAALAQREYISWDITKIAKGWYDGSANYGISLKATKEDAMNTSSPRANVAFTGTDGVNNPIFVVHYRNTVGLEDYYTYNTQDIGRAGTGYISDYTGQFTLIKSDVANASTVMPFEMYHAYNSAYSTGNFPGVTVNAPKTVDMNLGYGWKLSAQQCVQEVTLQKVSQAALVDESYLVYTDADGTEHYFAKTGTNTYADEDGLGLTITCLGGTGSKYRMTDQKNNKIEFDWNGNMTAMIDRNDNRLNFNYSYTTDSKTRLMSITSQLNGQSAITVATLAYDVNGYLASITDRIGNVTKYTYTSINGSIQLTKITHPDGTTATYEYNGTGNRLSSARDNERKKSYVYSYTDKGTVSYVCDYYWDQNNNFFMGRQFDISRVQGKTTYRYSGSGNFNDSDDTYETLLFDNAGRTVNSSYMNYNQTKVLGAGASKYTPQSGTSKQNNRVTASASTGAAAVNMLKNSSVEETGSWNVSGTFGRVTTKGRSGKSSYRATTTTGTAELWQESITLKKGETYTFSAYVNTSGVTSFNASGGVYLKITADGGELKGETLKTITSGEIENGWQRLSLTLTANPGTATAVYKVYICCTNFNGTIYADDFQMETAESPSNFNLAVGGSMEFGGWTLGSGTSVVASQGRDGTSALKAEGNPEQLVSASCNIPISEKGGTYVLSGWGKASSVPEGNGRKFGFTVYVYYTNGTSEETYVGFNPDVTDWQYISTPVVPKEDKEVERISICFSYDYNGNMAYVDNVSLVRELAQVYSYDAQGNLTSVKTSKTKEETYTYSGANLKQLIGAKGVFDYTYDSKNNLETAKNDSVTMTLTYDNAGNNKTSTLSGTALTQKIKSSAEYTGNGNLVSKVTDSTGYSTTYSYGNDNSVYMMTGQPNVVKNAKNTETEYNYNTQNGRSTLSYINGTIDAAQTYNSMGQLSQIRRGGFKTGDGNKQDQRYFFSYDTFGNMKEIGVGESSQSRTLASYAYAGNNGNLKKMTYGNGQYVDYTYDALDRLKTISYNGVVWYTYTYTGDGQLYSVKDAMLGCTYQYEYDSIGRLVSAVQKSNDVVWGSNSRSYDVKGRLSKLAYSAAGFDSRYQTYTYSDATGNLSSMRTADGTTHSYLYDPLQRLTKRTSGSLYTKNYAYKTIDSTTTTTQVSALNYRKGTSSTNWIGYTYTYDELGNITKVTGNQNAEYSYDVQNQLTREKPNDDGNNGTTQIDYVYDTYGNILSSKYYVPGYATLKTKTYTYGDKEWKDLLTAYNGKSITYDTIGNPLTYRDGMSFMWNNGRELWSVRGANGSMCLYIYDADGNRFWKSLYGSAIYYEYVDGKLVGQSWANGKLGFFYDENGHPYQLTYYNERTGVTNNYYYITNLQGDVMKLVDESYTEVASYTYSAYGEILKQSGTMADLNPLRYRGYYYDEETGFYLTGTRYYDPVTCRFINADSADILLENEDDSFLKYNLFAYCYNNPVSMVDHTGESPANIVGGIVGGATGAALGYLLAEHLGLTGWKKWAMIAAATAGGAALGAVLGPYVAKLTGKIAQAVKTAATTTAKQLCFVAGTLVETQDGHIPIENVKAGDYVFAENPETGEKGLKRVVQTFVNQTNELVHIEVNGEKISTTPEHPFYSPEKGWMDAIELRSDDKLVLRSGEIVIVEQVQHEIFEAPITVYNFEVEDFHTYYVTSSSVLVHNACSLNKLTDSFIKKTLKLDAHAIKKEFLHKGAKIASYDLAVDKATGIIWIVDKAGKAIVETYYKTR